MNYPISVVIPLYNKEDFIRRALNSVLTQTYAASEIIVINDGTSDSSARIVAEEYPSVKLISQDNAGVSVARNKGLALATFNLVAFLDADDQFFPQHLYYLNELYNKYPGFALYGNAYSQLSTDCNRCTEAEYHIKNYVSAYVIEGGIVNSSTAMINKGILGTSKVFPEGVAMGEDVYAWVKLSSLSNGEVPVSSYVGAIYYDDTGGAMNLEKPKPYPEILKKGSLLEFFDKESAHRFERHFLEDYVRSVYKFGSRLDLLIALLKVRKIYVLKFGLKIFVSKSIIEFFKPK